MSNILSSRPLISATISFVAGISWTASGLFYLPALWAALILLLYFHGCSRLRSKSFSPLSLIPLLFFWIGAVHAFAPPAQPDTTQTLHRLLLEKREVTVSGRLLTCPEKGNQRSKLLLAADHLYCPGTDRNLLPGLYQNRAEKLIRLPSRSVNTRILLRMNGHPPPSISPGDHLLIRTVLSRPDRYGTPGSFDYPGYLGRKSIFLQGWIQSPLHIVELEKSPLNLPLLRKFLVQAERLRLRINTFLLDELPSRQAGLYLAILTGDREMVKPDILENFKKTGVMHLLAISGVHMGLLALSCGLGFTFLIRRSEWLLLRYNSRKIVCLLSIPVLLLYALIAGLNPPVLRALIMTVIFFMAIINDRQHHLPTHVSMAAFVILSVNPLLLFSASFQLSFAAVIGIIVVLPRVRALTGLSLPSSSSSLPKRFLDWLLAGLLVSVAASLATLPILLYYFNRFSPLSPLSTLLVEPLICFWSLLIGLFSCPLIFFSPEAAEFLLRIGGIGLKGADLITGKLAALPLADIRLSTPSLMEITCYYLLLAAVFLAGQKDRRRQLVVAGSAAVLLISPLYYKYQWIGRNYDRIHFLDVGQGSCSIIETQNGKVAIIDGGGPYSEKFNVGRAVIAPFLWKKRISKIDLLVISHLDSDHYNGLPFIIRNFRPEQIWLNDPEPGGSITLSKLLEEAERNGRGIEVPEQGEILCRSPTTALQNLSGLHRGGGYQEENNRSLVLKLTSNGFSFLFPGDIEKNAEAEILRNGRDIKADVLLAPHHGSRSSSSVDFVRTVAPDYTVISAGKYRKNTFPAQESLDTYRDLRSKIYNTAHLGTITFETMKSDLTVKTFFKGGKE